MSNECSPTGGLFVTSAILSAIAIVLFMVGATGHTGDAETVKEIPWGVGDYEGLGTGDFFLGLQGFVINPDDIDDDYGFDNFLAYDNDSCGDEDYCDTCQDAGAASVAMCVLALVFAVVNVGFGVAGAVSGDSMGWTATIGCTTTAAVAAVFSIIGFLVYRPCISDFVDFIGDLAGEAEATYGIGAWLTLVGCIFMFIAAILSAITLCLGTASNGMSAIDQKTTASVGL